MKNERKRSKYAGIRSNNVSGQGNMEREDFLIKRLCWHFAVGIPLTSINNDLCNYFAFFLFQDQSSGTLLPPCYLRGTAADFDICSIKIVGSLSREKRVFSSNCCSSFLLIRTEYKYNEIKLELTRFLRIIIGKIIVLFEGYSRRARKVVTMQIAGYLGEFLIDLGNEEGKDRKFYNYFS